MPNYVYVCLTCGSVSEVIEFKFLSAKEDNARPASDRPWCPKCNEVMVRSGDAQPFAGWVKAGWRRQPRTPGYGYVHDPDNVVYGKG